MIQPSIDAVEIQPDFAVTGRRPSQILEDEAGIWIRLSRGLWAVTDRQYLALVIGLRWYATKGRSTFYATRGRPGCAMHRLILGAAKGAETDHINGNGLDNRSHNIRICTVQQNQCNRGPTIRNASGFKGVSFDPKRGKWRAEITRERRKYRLGRFDTAEAAHRAYCNAALKHHGEFARVA